MKSCLAVLAAIAAVLFAGGCSSSAPTPASNGHSDHAGHSDHDDADVTFATMMIPHHEQAVTLSALVPERSSNPEVIKLAADISAAQAPEIQTMKGWLAEWSGGAPTGQEGHDMSHMKGMVDKATMTELTTLKGADFDRLWLQSMIGHHEGAVGMADTELKDGQNAEAKTLAQQIITSQQGEIDQMKRMLG